MSKLKGGYIGKILRIDLSKNETKTHPIEYDFATRFIGGRGWGAKIIFDETSPTTDPLGPENLLVIATGPLTGALLPGAGKLSLSGISPQTGLYGDSNVGSMLGVELKQAGFDAMVIKGTSEKPTYISVDNGDVELKDATHLWGIGSLDTEVKLRKELGSDVRVLTIGPAGENLVKFACVTGDYGRQAGRTGMGTILGSKKVKAIVVRGDKDIPIANLRELERAFEKTRDYIVGHKDWEIWRRQGTTQVVDWSQEQECLPTKNFQYTIYDSYQKIDGYALEKRKVGTRACFSCPMPCRQLTIEEKSGKRAMIEGPEYETASLIGSNCALPDMDDLIYANYLCDNLGLDTISAGVVASFAMECYEKGILSKSQLGGLDLKFGNSKALFEFLKMVAKREGMGNLFAEGVKKASEKIGKGSEKFAMQVKGLEVSGYEHRAAQAMALAYATCLSPTTELFFLNEPMRIGDFVDRKLTEAGVKNGAVLINPSPLTLSWSGHRLDEGHIIAVQKIPAPTTLLRIKTSSGVSVDMTEDHSILVERRDGPLWIRASRVKIGDYVYSPRIIGNGNGVRPLIIDLTSDEALVDDKDVIRLCGEALTKRYGSIRNASRALNIPRRPFNENSKQGLKLKYIKQVCCATGLRWEDISKRINEVRGNAGLKVTLARRVLNEDFAYILGLLASDSHIKRGKRYKRPSSIIFTNSDEKLLNLFISKHKGLFPTVPLRVRRKGRSIDVVSSNFVVSDTALRLGLKSNFHGIFKLPPSLIKSFIRGFFDGNGMCYLKRGSYYHIKITSRFYERAKKLHQLLKRLGIRSSVFCRGSSFDVSINTPGDKVKFATIIGSFHPLKASRLSEIKNTWSRYPPDGYDLMPIYCGKMIRRIREHYGIAMLTLPIYRGQLRAVERSIARLRRETLKRIVEKLERVVPKDDPDLIFLRDICKTPFYIDKVVSIKRLKSDNPYVYDITVKEEHNFIPEGAFVVRNCDIGAHHNRAWAITYDVKVGRNKYGRDKVKEVIRLQHARSMFDCIGVCRLQWVELGLDLNFYAKFYTAVTGVPMSLRRLLRASERIYNLTRLINVRRGVTRKDDSLPHRDFADQVPSGRFKGAKIDKPKFERMLDTYYKLRGWNEEGRPTKKKLKELNLETSS